MACTLAACVVMGGGHRAALQTLAWARMSVRCAVVCIFSLVSMKTFRFVCLLTLFTATSARACDVCGCYTPNQELNSEPLHPREGGFYLTSAEQCTFFGTTKLSVREVPYSADQYEQSSITQLIGGYHFNDHLGVQINAPLIGREYKRPEGFVNERGTVSGLRDMSLLFDFVAVHKETDLGLSAHDGRATITATRTTCRSTPGWDASSCKATSSAGSDR